MTLTLSVLPDRFGICRLDPEETPPVWATAGPFFSVTRTSEELSVVCIETAIPGEIACEKGWRCLKVHGPLDFSLTGVLSSLTDPLAEANVGVFAVSTYDTDYLLVRETDLAEARAALSSTGHRVLGA